MEFNGSGEAYGFDEQTIHRSMLDLGFKQCSTMLCERVSDEYRVQLVHQHSLYMRNPKSAQALVSAAPCYALIGMQI